MAGISPDDRKNRYDAPVIRLLQTRKAPREARKPLEADLGPVIGEYRTHEPLIPSPVPWDRPDRVGRFVESFAVVAGTVAYLSILIVVLSVALLTLTTR